jgi:hypothetical protein
MRMNYPVSQSTDSFDRTSIGCLQLGNIQGGYSFYCLLQSAYEGLIIVVFRPSICSAA